MKLSKLWLHEWVNVSINEQELAAQLTMAGLEVDAVSPVAGEFSHVIVAKVLGTQPHPNADKLTLCDVDANGDKPLKIVCGASNVRPGFNVALAMIGAELPGGFKIKESKLRGELSQGMLCSASELGLDVQCEGILELDEEAPIGMDVRDYFSLNDHTLDIDLTPNRADCLSVLGIAREVAVLNNTPLIEPMVQPITPEVDDEKSVHVVNPEACPHYCGRIIRGINPHAKTPLWMSERLRRSGIRAVHPVVDVMNYVMLELGQPMHAFDCSTIEGDIYVRLAHEKEQLALLDGQTLTFDEQVLVIADSKKPLAMAGVMGGGSSAVQEHTKDVFLESAFFNPITIAGVARKYGLFSDSSQRFERGVDPSLQIKALERATGLILSISGGQAGPIVQALDLANRPRQAAFSFDTALVKKLTGVSLSIAQMKTLLLGIGVKITQEHEGILDVLAPTHRFDIQIDVDLVEEIIRLYGYDKIAAQPIDTSMTSGKTCAHEQMSQRLALWFRSKGYHETISYSFVDPELQAAIYPNKQYLQLLNPISSELSQMRAGLWPGLIASMIHNSHRQQSTIKLFELGVAFDYEQSKLDERPCIAGLLTGEHGALNWSEETRIYDFFDLKGDLQALFAQLKLEKVEFIPANNDALHPGKSAQIMIEGQHAGWIGVLHPQLNDALDVPHEVMLFELNLDALQKDKAPRYQPISKYPQIRRDLSFLVDKDVKARQIEQVIRATIDKGWLKSLDVFDVYFGKGIPDGKKSLAIAMTLQDDTRTLVDSEINSLISAIINSLEHEFSITLRE